MVPHVVGGVVVLLLTTLCFLYLCKRATDDAVRTLSAGYDRDAGRRSMRNAGIGTTVRIGEATEAECVFCGRWPSALRPVMRNAIDRLPLKKPVCEACVVVFWRNCVGRVIEPKGPCD
jgi:hypothetical protein